jgi:hypothetical protein
MAAARDTLHSRMLDEQPRRYFWANDDAIKLARRLRAALDKITSTTIREEWPL